MTFLIPVSITASGIFILLASWASLIWAFRFYTGLSLHMLMYIDYYLSKIMWDRLAAWTTFGITMISVLSLAVLQMTAVILTLQFIFSH